MATVTSAQLDPVLKVGDSIGQPQDGAVLQCVTGAITEGVRACCAKALGQRGELPNTLGDAADFPQKYTLTLCKSSFSHRFGLNTCKCWDDSD